MFLLKIFFLFSLIFQTSFILSNDLKCQRNFTLINNQNSNEEIMKERQKNIAEHIDWVMQAIRYMENTTPQENPLRNVKVAMMERNGGGMGYGINYPSYYSAIPSRLLGDYHKILDMIVETISSLSQEHSKIKHGLWSHIIKITGQQNESLFPSGVGSDVLKIHFNSILDFLIDYLEHKDLQIAINLSFAENRITEERTVNEKIKRIRNLILADM